MKYADFASQFQDRYADLLQRWPLSSFVLDHYLKLSLLEHRGAIQQHLGYLRQTLTLGYLVDLLSRGLSSYIRESAGCQTLLVSTALVHSFPWLVKDLKGHEACRKFNLKFYGLSSYNHRLIIGGYAYFSLYLPLFERGWTENIFEAVKILDQGNDLFSWDGWSRLESQLQSLVERLQKRLVEARVAHLVGLRDFFWYEAALVLACQRATIPYHVVAHGYPHSDPAYQNALGFLPFRGDFLYCMSDESYSQLSPWVPAGMAKSVRLFSSRVEENGTSILFISSVAEEFGILDSGYRLRVYGGLKEASVRTGRRVVVRFRDDERLEDKIRVAKSYGFSWTVKNKVSLEDELKNASIVFGYSSTALYISRSFGLPTYNVGGYGPIEGVEMLLPERIAEIVARGAGGELMADFRPTFADEFFSKATGWN